MNIIIVYGPQGILQLLILLHWNLVLEGRADFFAMKLFPINIHPFINRLTENQERTIWSLIKPQLNMRNSSMNEHKMYGT